MRLWAFFFGLGVAMIFVGCSKRDEPSNGDKNLRSKIGYNCHISLRDADSAAHATELDEGILGVLTEVESDWLVVRANVADIHIPVSAVQTITFSGVVDAKAGELYGDRAAP